jgi:hypothetical protein
MTSKGFVTYESLFGSTAQTTDSAERVPIVLGVQIAFTAPGRVMGLRWFRDRNDDGYHIGIIRTPDNLKPMRFAIFREIAADAFGVEKWLNAYFRPWLRVASGDTIIADVFSQKGYWWYTPGLYATTDFVSGGLTAPHHSGSFFQGLYSYASQIKTENDGGGSAYGVDILFLPD